MVLSYFETKNKFWCTFLCISSVCLFVFFATVNLKFLEIDARGFEINGYTRINGYTTIMLHQQNPYILFLRLRETKNVLQLLCNCQLPFAIVFFL